MMITNATITIYNRKRGDKDTYDTWNRTVLRDVHVYIDHKTALTESGLKSADVYKIRIPEEVENADRYLPPEEYERAETSEEYWTIQNDDQIVIGECEMEIEKPSNLTAVSQRHCKVNSWSDNRFGSIPHWRVGGE